MELEKYERYNISGHVATHMDLSYSLKDVSDDDRKGGVTAIMKYHPQSLQQLGQGC
jgi:hypothetical protein